MYVPGSVGKISSSDIQIFQLCEIGIDFNFKAQHNKAQEK